MAPANLSFGNLNLRNPSTPSTDAYVLVSLGGHVNLTDQEEESGQEKQKRYTAKTKVCRRSLNPVWDEGKIRKIFVFITTIVQKKSSYV
jgi:hypothetical protein